MEASNLSTLIQLVANNMGTTLVPTMSVKYLIGNNPELKKSLLKEPGPHRELAIIVRPTYIFTENITLLQKLFKDTLKNNI